MSVTLASDGKVSCKPDLRLNFPLELKKRVRSHVFASKCRYIVLEVLSSNLALHYSASLLLLTFRDRTGLSNSGSEINRT